MNKHILIGLLETEGKNLISIEIANTSVKEGGELANEIREYLKARNIEYSPPSGSDVLVPVHAFTSSQQIQQLIKAAITDKTIPCVFKMQVSPKDIEALKALKGSSGSSKFFEEYERKAMSLPRVSASTLIEEKIAALKPGAASPKPSA